MPVHAVSPVISREGFQHTVGAGVCGCRGTWQHEERLTATRVLWSVQKPEQLQLWWLWVFLINCFVHSVVP